MNPVSRLIAMTIAGLIVCTMIVLVVLISVGHAHATTTGSHTSTAHYAERGHGGHHS
jgi:hypothetical protein